MIKANELRIGNYAQDALTKTVLRLDGFHQQSPIFEVIDRSKYPLPNGWQAEPIPLTPEVLERCGFEKSLSEDIEERIIYGIQCGNNTSLYYDPHQDHMRNHHEVEWYLSYEWNNNHFKNDFWAKPKYLHQLQNLYYALTAQELKYKP